MSLLPLRVKLLVGLLAVMIAHCGTTTAADEAHEKLLVQIVNGREFTGYLDSRTNDDRLWLRSELGGAVLWRPIAWSAVHAIVQGNQTFDPNEVRQQRQRWISTSPQSLPDAAPPPRPRSVDSSSIVPVAPARVVSVAADARLSNWDADVEHDGLTLTVLPLDVQGNLVAVEGSVEVQLIGEGPGTTQRLTTFPSLGRWVEPIRAAEITPNGVKLRLTFQALHPEFNLRLSPYGVVHVRLSAPGHGTFETTTELTTLRPYNPLRDRLQQQTQQRFFPIEQTGVGKQISPSLSRGG